MSKLFEKHVHLQLNDYLERKKNRKNNNNNKKKKKKTNYSFTPSSLVFDVNTLAVSP